MKTLFFCDLDATITHVGDRFKDIPVPAVQDRGNPEFEAYLNTVQSPELLLADKPVPGMLALVNALPEAVYLTSRDEKYRDVTEQWLRENNFPSRKLIMRPNGNTQRAAYFKQDAIRNLLTYWYHDGNTIVNSEEVVVVDDDQSNALAKVCKENGWTMLKAVSGGDCI